MQKERADLTNLISLFNRNQVLKNQKHPYNVSFYQAMKTSNEWQNNFMKNNLDARPILYPTVPLGAERLRITLHSFNTVEETMMLIDDTF